MKSKAKILCIALLLAAASIQMPAALFTQTPAAAAEQPIRVYFNEKRLVFSDTQPIRDENGNTLVPVRAIAEAMGCTMRWDGDARTVTLTRGRVNAKMTVGDSEITVLGVKKAMSSSAAIQNGRTLAPLRHLAEAFGATVTWDNDAKTISIIDEGNDIYRLGRFVWNIEKTDRIEINSEGLMKITKQSGLILDERQVGDDLRKVMAIHITVDEPEKDIEGQRAEAAELLGQHIGSELVGEIMERAAMKEDGATVIERKYFQDENYQAYVTGYIGPIVLYIYL